MQNEIRLIDANALISAIEKGEGISWERYGDNEVCVRKKYIDLAPTIAWCNRTSDGLPLLDLRERPQGEWITEYDRMKCPFCGMSIDDEVHWLYSEEYNFKFCPNCGAELRGDTND